MIFTPSTMHFKTAANKEPMRGLTVAGTMQLLFFVLGFYFLSHLLSVKQQCSILQPYPPGNGNSHYAALQILHI